MAKLMPFKAVRPPRDKVHLVAARSYVSYSRRDLREKLDRNPFSFIHIINPEHGSSKKSRPNSADRFKKVRSQFDLFLQKEYFFTEKKPCFYIYRQEKKSGIWTGIIACASVEDYNNGIIKKHEHTLKKREHVLKKYLGITRFNAEPVLLTYPDDQTVNSVIDKYMSTDPEYDYTTTDRIRQKLWVIDNDIDIEIVQEAFSQFNSIYIADGHHRAASSALLADELKKKGEVHDGSELFMAYYIPESNLKVLPFHRIIKQTHIAPEELLHKIKDRFTVSAVKEKKPAVPEKLNEIVMYMSDGQYRLTLKDSFYEPEHPVHSLAAQILASHILQPYMGIEDIRTDKKVTFKGGENGHQSAFEAVKSGNAELAFILPPVTIEQLKRVADNNQVMPPKTTWIEPKLRSGLTIYWF